MTGAVTTKDENGRELEYCSYGVCRQKVAPFTGAW